MGKNYAKANWIPVGNYWKGRSSTAPLVVIIHGTASGATQTGADLGRGEFNNPASNASTHYAIDKDGTVTQFVDEADTAWGNCCVHDGPTGNHDPHFTAGVNQNPRTISIEHLKVATDNSDQLTEAQKAASFDLIYDICKRNRIPMQWVGSNGGIAFHASIDMLTRAHCPGPYPLAELLAYLKQRAAAEGTHAVAVKLAANGEVRDFNQADQFQPLKSQFECGFFATVIAAASAPVGKSPVLSVDQIITLAERDYLNTYGSNASSMTWGMSTQQLYNMMTLHGLGYRAVQGGVDGIRAWIKAGFPVIVGVAEVSVYDKDLGRNPYPWTASGNHVFVLTGLDSNGLDFLVRDAANCTNLYDPNSLRPGPRRYVAADLQFVSMTACIFSDMPQPAVGFDPRTETLSMLPTGWKQNGSDIVAPNGIKVQKGFAAYVLSHSWEADNVPMEVEHLMNVDPYSTFKLGTDGSGQLFARTYLRWTPARGVYEERAGALFGLTQDRLDSARKEVDTLAAQLASANKEVALLKGEVVDDQKKEAAEDASEITVTVPPVVITTPTPVTPVVHVPNAEQVQIDALQKQLADIAATLAALNKQANA